MKASRAQMVEWLCNRLDESRIESVRSWTLIHVTGHILAIGLDMDRVQYMIRCRFRFGNKRA
jgi:hypothetical protein